MKNSNERTQGLVVKDDNDLKKVCNSVLKPNEKKKRKDIETIRNTFSKIGIK